MIKVDNYTEEINERLQKKQFDYGKTAITAGAAVLMALYMVINQSLVAQTFGSYTLQLFDIEDNSIWVPALGVALLIFAYFINVSGNKVIGRLAE